MPALMRCFMSYGGDSHPVKRDPSETGLQSPVPRPVSVETLESQAAASVHKKKRGMDLRGMRADMRTEEH